MPVAVTTDGLDKHRSLVLWSIWLGRLADIEKLSNQFDKRDQTDEIVWTDQ